MQCLMAASQNRIDPIRYDGELKDIALKAMATQQEDRYQTVKEFQEAVRVYQSHSESLVLTAHANQNLQKARDVERLPALTPGHCMASRNRSRCGTRTTAPACC